MGMELMRVKAGLLKNDSGTDLCNSKSRFCHAFIVDYLRFNI